MHAGSNTSYGRKWSSGNTVGCLIDVSPGYPSGSHASIRSLLCVHALTDGTLECFWLYLSTRLLVVAVCRSRWKAETSDALSPSPWPTARLVVISDHSLNQHPHHTTPRTPLQTLTFDLHPLIILQIAWLCPAISANSPAQWNFAFRPAHMRFLPRGYQAWGEVMQRLHNLEEVRRTPQLTLGWVVGSNEAESHYGDSHVPRLKFTLAFLCSHSTRPSQRVQLSGDINTFWKISV